MNREVQFRAYHKEDKKMCEITTFNIDNKGAFLLGLAPAAGQYLAGLRAYVPPLTTGRYCNADEFFLMQFTGLLDKNGEDDK